MDQDTLNTQLADAVKSGDLAAVKTAINQGADVHYSDDCMVSWAAQHGRLHILKFLVEEQQCAVDSSDNYALRHACAFGFLDIVQYLESKGGDIFHMSNRCLRAAAHNGYLNIVEYLVQQGANIHAEDDYALRSAAENGFFDVVRFLVECGANIYALNQDAYKGAYAKGYSQVADFLRDVAHLDSRFSDRYNFALPADYETLDHFRTGIINTVPAMAHFSLAGEFNRVMDLQDKNSQIKADDLQTKYGRLDLEFILSRTGQLKGIFNPVYWKDVSNVEALDSLFTSLKAHNRKAVAADYSITRPHILLRQESSTSKTPRIKRRVR